MSIDVTLEKAEHRIHGVVTNEHEKPMSAAVSLFQNQVVIQKTQTTQEDGGFEFAVKDGHYGVFVQAPFYQIAAWNGLVSESDKNVNFKLVRLALKKPTAHNMAL